MRTRVRNGDAEHLLESWQLGYRMTKADKLATVKDALATERRILVAEIRERVEALPAYEEHDETLGMDIYDPLGVRRAGVLAILDESEAAR